MLRKTKEMIWATKTNFNKLNIEFNQSSKAISMLSPRNPTTLRNLSLTTKKFSKTPKIINLLRILTPTSK